MKELIFINKFILQMRLPLLWPLLTSKHDQFVAVDELMLLVSK